ncbi:MAG: hypothetical protein J5590_10005 [Clostridia bacterium]|nr:hypothetical protein [Clostridia bacterium]
MEQKEIRFIDSNYNDLFKIPDGGYVSVKYPNGNTDKLQCRFIDDYHAEIGGDVYHICQWAEMMEKIGITYSPAEIDENTAIKAENIKFVEQNYGKINQDKFFKTDYGFEEIYYNPDSTAGGQLVYNKFDYDLIREAAKWKNDVVSFFDYLNYGCRQYLVDIDTPEFMDCLKEFINRTPDFLKDSEETANGMLKAAFNEKKKQKNEPER